MLLNKPEGDLICSAEEVVSDFIALMKTKSFLDLGRVGQKFARGADTANELELLKLYMEISEIKEVHQSWLNL